MAWTRENTAVNQSGGTSATAIVATLSRAALNGELLAVVLSWDGTGYSGPLSVTDNGTGTANTWVKAWETVVAADGQWSALFWAVNARTSSTITTVTGNFTQSVSYRGIIVETWSGNDVQANQPSVAAASTGASHTTAANNVTAGSNITPGADGALVLAGGYGGGSATITAGTNYSGVVSAGANYSMYAEQWVQTTATATNGNATASAGGNHSWGVIAFKAAAGGATGNPWYYFAQQ